LLSINWGLERTAIKGKIDTTPSTSKSDISKIKIIKKKAWLCSAKERRLSNFFNVFMVQKLDQNSRHPLVCLSLFLTDHIPAFFFS
jgi:hypothetical protein